MTTYNWQVLRAGEFWLDAGAMFGIIPKAIWQRWLTPDDQNRMPLQQNSLLLECDGKLIVIETGIGDKFGEKERTIYRQQDRHIHTALGEIDCSPDDIDAVILTHLHFDHAGGLTRLDPENPDPAHPRLTFPNAEIIVQRREWEDAIANKSTMHKTYLRSHLNEDVAERLTLIDGEAEVFPDLWVWPVPGHTWGQQAVRFTDGAGQTVVFTPDVMPTRYHSAPAACMAYDVESYTSQQERIKLLREAEAGAWLLALVHEHDHPVFTVRPNTEKPGAYLLDPAAAREASPTPR